MYIHPFLAGVLFTIFTEVIMAIGWVIIANGKEGADWLENIWKKMSEEIEADSIKESAKLTRCFYKSFIEEGFTPQEALYLIGEIRTLLIKEFI